MHWGEWGGVRLLLFVNAICAAMLELISTRYPHAPDARRALLEPCRRAAGCATAAGCCRGVDVLGWGAPTKRTKPQAAASDVRGTIWPAAPAYGTTPGSKQDLRTTRANTTAVVCVLSSWPTHKRPITDLPGLVDRVTLGWPSALMANPSIPSG